MSLKSSLKTVLTLGKGLAGGIPEAADDANPIELFTLWYEAAEESGVLLPEATALATADATGAPSVRMVLLKSVDEGGFVFFTNYESRKAGEMDENPRAALCLHWAIHQRQIRVTGRVARISTEESAAYFASRPRGKAGSVHGRRGRATHYRPAKSWSDASPMPRSASTAARSRSPTSGAGTGSKPR